MTTKIQKWGNSLGVRIPRDIAREINIRETPDIAETDEEMQKILDECEEEEEEIEEITD